MRYTAEDRAARFLPPATRNPSYRDMSQRCLDFDSDIVSSKASGSHGGVRPPMGGIGLHLNSLGAFSTPVNGILVRKTERVCEAAAALDKCESAGQDGTTLGAPSVDSAPLNIHNKATRKRLLAGKDDNEAAENSGGRAAVVKKRRKSAASDGSCKRCSCKKSKCLKLYCECFASGTFCLDSCACRDCSNKPEHEETVMEVRQLIRSRNPLAFAPRVIAAEGSPEDDQEGATTKHKRGCNCKKSLCLKKYCECYQSEVGCSVSCKCVGCKNTFGIKQDADDGDQSVPPSSSDVAEANFGFYLGTAPASPALLRAISAYKEEPILGHKEFESPLNQATSSCSKSSSIHTFGSPLHGICIEGGNSVRKQLSPELSLSRTGTPEPMSRSTTRSVVVGEYKLRSGLGSLKPGLHSLQSKALEADEEGLPDFLLDPSEVQSATAAAAAAAAAAVTSSPKKKRVTPPQVAAAHPKPVLPLKNARKLTLQALPGLPPVSSIRRNSTS